MPLGCVDLLVLRNIVEGISDFDHSYLFISVLGLIFWEDFTDLIGWIVSIWVSRVRSWCLKSFLRSARKSP